MKKMCILLATLFMFTSFSVMAEKNNDELIATVKNDEKLNWTIIDEDNIVAAEVFEYIPSIAEDGAEQAYMLWLPIKDSDKVYQLWFTPEYEGAVSAKAVEPQKEFSKEKATEYAVANGLNEPTQISDIYIMGRPSMHAYKVVCDNEIYYIPYYFYSDSKYNVTENDECNLEIGTAYSKKAFIEIGKKESELHQEYFNNKNLQSESKTTDEGGDIIENSAKNDETKSEDKTEPKEDNKSETKAEEKTDVSVPAQPTKKEFIDVPATHRAYGGITELADKGVLSGYEDGTFRADAYVTRAEMARIISGVTGGLTSKVTDTVIGTGFDIPGSAKYEFSDVNTDYWAMNDIAHCKGLGLIDGYEDGTFKPNENVSVAEAVKICLSATGYNSMIMENDDTWYAPWIDMAVEYKILDSSNIDPNSKMTRADVAELVSKTINLPMYVLAGYDISAGEEKYQFEDGADGRELRTLSTTYLQAEE